MTGTPIHGAIAPPKPSHRLTGILRPSRDSTVIIVVKPFGAAPRLTGMKKQLGVAAGLALALAMAGCGQGQPVMARGVAMREPLVSPRPYGAADTAFGLDVLG